MDLRTNQETVGLQGRYSPVYRSHVFNATETYGETDIKGNTNLFNFLKTEANVNLEHNPGSLFQVKFSNKEKLEVDNSLFSYSSFKKAMDLRIHNRTLDGGKRSIFEDAEYFSKNYCYKLLPVTFEQVDESIIQSEHNYSLFSLTSESEPEENCSRMMDYSQIKKKNYKRRRSKFGEGGDREELVEDGTFGGIRSSTMLSDQNEGVSATQEHPNAFEPESSTALQPLDLSAGPLVQDEKTDSPLRERPNSNAELHLSRESNRVDSDKENLNSDLNGIRVTITRPDEKENYQPCDLFLNDIARLIPWLIDKDCFEVDILDRTCDDRDEFRKHRLYYVISESTWRMFQKTNERVILTNDQSLGQPFRKTEKVEKPSYLVFDQFSLAKCLAEYCQEIGGCFEYTCVEGEKEEDCSDDKGAKVDSDSNVVKRLERVPEAGGSETVEEKVEGKTKEMKMKREETPQALEKELEKATESTQKKEKTAVDEASETSSEETVCVELGGNSSEYARVSESEEKISSVIKTGKERRRQNKNLELDEEREVAKKETEEKSAKRIKSPTIYTLEPRPRTRSKSTSESETSQKSDKPIFKKERKREASTLRKLEPPSKLKKTVDVENSCRKTRSGKILEETKTDKPTVTEKESKRPKEGTKRCRAPPRKAKETRRVLRSRKMPQEQEKEKEKEKGKGKEREVVASKSKGTKR